MLFVISFLSSCTVPEMGTSFDDDHYDYHDDDDHDNDHESPHRFAVPRTTGREQEEVDNNQEHGWIICTQWHSRELGCMKNQPYWDPKTT